jgi:hypothetical protein
LFPSVVKMPFFSVFSRSALADPSHEGDTRAQ